MLLSNQIVGFFDHQYLSKEALNVTEFFCIEKVTKDRLLLRVPILVGCSQACPAMPKLP